MLIDGYRLYFGTNNPPGNIVDGLTISENQYQPEEFLSEGLDYFWKVIPYNSYGDGIGCDTWQFIVNKINPPMSFDASLNINDVMLSWSPPVSLNDSILVIDPDPNHSSGSIIASTLVSIGLPVKYTTTFQNDLAQYAAIFVCLGIYEQNHVLSDSEAAVLADYLNGGGNIYMEGGDTWYYDPQTILHPMFYYYSPTSFTSGINSISGEQSMFTEGMYFSYSGEDDWISELQPVNGASTIFKIPGTEVGLAIACNDQDQFATIASTFEFSGLVDDTVPSTKKGLLLKYLPIGIYHYYAKVLYEEGISVPSNIDSVDVVVGINDDMQDGVFVYPNPASNIVEIKSSQVISHISIYNSMGNKVFDKIAKANLLVLPINDLKPGVYYLEIYLGQKIVSRKLIIRKI